MIGTGERTQQTAGVDFPLLWVRLLRGERIDPTDSYAENVIVRWLWGDVKRFLHIVSGPPPGYRDPYPTIAQGVWELFGRQPGGTRLEVWDRTDPRPALGEIVQGVGELLGELRRPFHRGRLSPPIDRTPAPAAPQ